MTAHQQRSAQGDATRTQRNQKDERVNFFIFAAAQLRSHCPFSQWYDTVKQQIGEGWMEKYRVGNMVNKTTGSLARRFAPRNGLITQVAFNPNTSLCY